MSASVLSKYACSRDCKYAPSGVANHAASVPVDRTLASIEDSAMPTIIPIPAFADNYMCCTMAKPWSLEEHILTRYMPDASCPIAWPCWPDSCLEERILPLL